MVLMKTKDLLSMRDLTAEDITKILDLADEMKRLLKSDHKKSAQLVGSTIVLLFYEPSTRTSTSFDAAAKILGAVSCNMSVSNSAAANKGENLLDTAKTLSAMKFDMLVMRHKSSGAAHFIAKHIDASVINAGDGQNEHPTQALLDMLTMREKLGTLKGITVAIVGDVKHSRVAKSNIYGLSKMGAKVHICAPETLMFAEREQMAKNWGVKFFDTATECVKGADVVMALRLQLERMDKGLIPSIAEYTHFYGVSDELISHAKKGALVMHPGPANRGVEISSVTMDGPQSVITEQVTSGVAIRMAIMKIIADYRKESGGKKNV